MPPDSKSDLGEATKRSHKKAKPNLKITHDDHRLTINLVDQAQNQKRNDSNIFLNDSFSQPLLVEPPQRVDSLQRRKKSKKSKNCLNIFEKSERSSSPEITPESYKHLKEIISEANDSWSYLFLPIIHLANIDTKRLKTNKLIENFNNFKKQFQKPVEEEKPKRVQISASDSNLNNIKYDIKSLTYDEKHSSSSSGSCSEQVKVNKLDALKNEIDKTINEINSFKNEIINHEPRVQTVDVGINTDISMSNAVFKIKYEDEEDDEFDDTVNKNSSVKETNKLNEPFVESPSETNSTRTKHIDLPALTLIKNLNKKYNFSSMNDTDFSSPGLSRKNSKTIYRPKITQLESDSLDDYKSKPKPSNDYLLDDDNIFKKIFSRNLEQKANYINLEPIKKKDLSSSSITSSSSSDTYAERRMSKVYRKRESLMINEENKKRHSLKKLPVVDFGAQRLSNEYKLKIMPLKRSANIEPNRFHCCCCKCSCTEAPVYQTVNTTTMTKIPTLNKSKINCDSSCTSVESDVTKKSDENLSSYYFKSTKNHRKKNEFGLLSHDKESEELKQLDLNSFLDDLEMEKKNLDNDFDFIKNLIQSNENDEKINNILHEESEDDVDLVENKYQYILDSLHRPHSAFQFNEDRQINNLNLKKNLNETDLNSVKSYRNKLFLPKSQSRTVQEFSTNRYIPLKNKRYSQVTSPLANNLNEKSPIRFPLPINKDSDYENYLANKLKMEKKIKKSKKTLKKTNNYYIHYPISSTDSSVVNSPSTASGINSRRKHFLPTNSKTAFSTYLNPLRDSPSLTDNTQSESVLLNTYKLV